MEYLMKYEPYMLIAVREPHMSTTSKECDIDTVLFNNFEKAHYEMMEQLSLTFRNKTNQDKWFNVYRDDWAETDKFGFDKTSAWSDCHPNYKFSCKIVEI